MKEQRRDNLENQNASMFEDNERIPISAHKNYDVSIVYGSNSKVKAKAISDLNVDGAGCVISLKDGSRITTTDRTSSKDIRSFLVENNLLF